jgi:hypothetical protein
MTPGEGVVHFWSPYIKFWHRVIMYKAWVAIHPVFPGLSPVLTILTQCPDRFVRDGQMSWF